MAHQNPADLEWLAFQYVSDELSAADLAQFEERLTTDQPAREAVAEAMLLLQAVAAGAKIASPATPQRSWLQPAAWAAIGAAACLAIVLVQRSLPRDPAIAQMPQAADLTSAELALVWALNGSYEDSSLAELAVEEDTGLVADGERDVIVPAWMLEALSGSEEIKPAVKESQES